VTKAALRAGCGTDFRAALKAASRVPRSGTLAARTPDPERLFFAGHGRGRRSPPMPARDAALARTGRKPVNRKNIRIARHQKIGMSLCGQN